MASLQEKATRSRGDAVPEPIVEGVRDGEA